jgi:rhodanese-related sulfurtransferase
MKERKLYYLLYLFIAATFIFFNTGCSDDKDPVTPDPVNESEELVKYFEGTIGGNFVNTLVPTMKTATEVNTDITTAVNIAILDIRSATDFALGHIQGAVNVAPADLLTYYQANNLSSKTRVIIACYTGQTAGFAASVLRLAGYSNVFSLKWGMCSWAYPSKWDQAKTNGQTNPITVQTTSNAKNTAGNLPTLSTGKTTGAEISTVRLAAVLAEGFGAASIDRTTLYANLSNYYIVNYWNLTDYNVGHIEGAIQYTPKEDLKLATFLKTLPTNKTIVVYCYSGQTSAFVVPFLRALGYDAKSLLYGTNNLFYDTMPGTKWGVGDGNTCMNYTVVQ